MVAHSAAKLHSTGRNKRMLLMRSNCATYDGAVQASITQAANGRTLCSEVTQCESQQANVVNAQ